MEYPTTQKKRKPVSNPEQIITQLCTKILTLFLEEKEIQHSLLERLISSIIAQFCEHNSELGDSFNNLSEAIKIAYQTNDLSKEYEKGFETGLLYAMVFGVDYYNRKKKEDSDINEAKVFIENKQRETIIRIIDEHDGLSQTELLSIYNERFPGKEIRKSRMSQILSDLKTKKIVYDTSIGKNKYYHLTIRGEYLIDQIISNQNNNIDSSYQQLSATFYTIDIYNEISKKYGYSRNESSEVMISEPESYTPVPQIESCA